MISKNSQAQRKKFWLIFLGKDMNNTSQKIQNMIDGMKSKRKVILTKMIYCLEVMKKKNRRNTRVIFPIRKI